MPYTVTRKGNKVLIKKKKTGKMVGHSDSMAKAKASVRARYMAEESPEKMKNNKEMQKMMDERLKKEMHKS